MFVNSNVRNAYIWVLGQNAPTSGHFAQPALSAIGQRRKAPACYAKAYEPKTQQ